MRHTVHHLSSFAFRLFAATVLIGTVLSACSGGTPTPGPAVKDTATPQPPVAATPVPPTTEPDPATGLVGTYWTLVSYIDDQGNTASVLPDTVIDAAFTADQVGGTAGCNHYFADYQLDGDSLTLGPVGATLMACGEALDSQEMHVLAALGNSATYQMTSDQLQIVGADGATLLTFTRAEAAKDAPGAQAWTDEMLDNATYTIEGLGDVQLVDGVYEHAYGDGATMVDTVGVVTVAPGDLDNDGTDDAVVILSWQSGGSGTFLYIVAMRNNGGSPRQVGILPLGDRVQPGKLAITGGTIALEALTHGPDDPMCCPSQKAIQTYALEGDTLSLISSEGVSPELVSTIWTWVRFDNTAGTNNIIVDDPSRYTLEFLADGTYKLQADCNQGSGGYTLDGSSLTLGPGPMTMAECAPGSLYDDYVTRLGDVVTFTFDSGTLVLNLKTDAGNMVFAKAEQASQLQIGTIVT